MEKIAWDLKTGHITAYRRPRPPVTSQLSLVCKIDDLTVCYNLIVRGLKELFSADSVKQARPRSCKGSEGDRRNTKLDGKASQLSDGLHRRGPLHPLDDELAKIENELANRRKLDESRKYTEEASQTQLPPPPKHRLFVNRPLRSMKPVSAPTVESVSHEGQLEKAKGFEPVSNPIDLSRQGPMTQLNISGESMRLMLASYGTAQQAYGGPWLDEADRKVTESRVETAARRIEDSRESSFLGIKLNNRSQEGFFHQVSPQENLKAYKPTQPISEPSQHSHTSRTRSRSPRSPHRPNKQLPRPDNSQSQSRAPPMSYATLSPYIKSSFSGLDKLLKQEAEVRGLSYCITESFKGGTFKVEVSLNSLRVAVAVDSNLSVAKGTACLHALKSIDDRLTINLSLM